MVKITYRMKNHYIDIPTQSMETRKNTLLPLSRGESENQLVPMLSDWVKWKKYVYSKH